MKNKYKWLSILECLLLLYCLSVVNSYSKNIICGNIKLNILNNYDSVVDKISFQNIFNEIKGQKFYSIDLNDVEKKIKSNNVIKEVNIFKTKNDIYVDVEPNKIVGVVYTINSENDQPQYILDNCNKLDIKMKREASFVTIIADKEDPPMDKMVSILTYINADKSLKALVNTIYIKENNFYVTTISNDCSINLGSILNENLIFDKLKKIHKIIYLCKDCTSIDFSTEALFLHKKK